MDGTLRYLLRFLFFYLERKKEHRIWRLGDYFLILYLIAACTWLMKEGMNCLKSVMGTSEKEEEEEEEKEGGARGKGKMRKKNK